MSATLADIGTESAEAGSVFSMHSATLVNLGFSPIPIVAGEKRPAISEWQRHSDHVATSDELARYARIPGAGIGVVLGSRVGAFQIVAVDLDVDGDDLGLLISALPDSPMKKRAAKGETLYYRADPALKTKRYRTEGERGLADLQAHRAQTVLPPSRHPSGVAYAWTAGPVRADMLPILTSIDLARFEDACRVLGWQEAAEATRAPERAAVAAHGAPQARGEASGFCRELNDIALANLDAWVPFLTGLYGTRRKPGGYEGVPLFRPSGENNPPERRKRNLSITASGIADWGDGQKGYTPINLVIVSEGIDPGAAIQWLKERVMPAVDGHEFDAVTASNGASARQAANAPCLQNLDIIEIAREDGTPQRIMTFDDRIANVVGAEEWLIKFLIPRTGACLIGGQTGVGKSFLTLDMAASVAVNQPWFGHRIKRPGGTFFLLGEGESTMAKRMRAVAEGRFHSEAPLDPSTGSPTIDIDRFPIGWMPVGEMVKPAVFESVLADVRIYQDRLRAQHGCDLALIVVDTVVSSFGFPDTPDDATAMHAMKTLAKLSAETGAAVVGIHHFGKSVEQGLTGTYAWGGYSEVVLGMTADKQMFSPTKNRNLSVIKNRHGDNEGWNRGWELKKVDFGVDEDGDPIKSAIAVPIVPTAINDITANNGAEPAVVKYLAALTTALDASGQDVPGPDGGIVRGVSKRIVRENYGRLHPGASDAVRMACDRSFRKAKAAGVVGEVMWSGEQHAFLASANDNTPCHDANEDTSG